MTIYKGVFLTEINFSLTLYFCSIIMMAISMLLIITAIMSIAIILTAFSMTLIKNNNKH